MNSTGDILGLDFDRKLFVDSASDFLNNSVKQKIKNSTSRLLTIAEKCSVDEEPRPQASIIDEVYRRYSIYYRTPSRLDLSSREIRILIYAMHKLKNKQSMAPLLQIMSQKWKPRFFNGLLYYLLSNWDSANIDVLEIVCDLVQQKLSEYDGHRDKFLLMKRNSRFLTINGAELLGKTLASKDRDETSFCSLKECCSVLFGMASNKLDFEYFSKVIVAYFERNGIHKLRLVEEILDLHNYPLTSKRLMPAMVLSAEKSGNEALKEDVFGLAVKEIGDPSVGAKWNLLKGSHEEKENILEARNILNAWIKRKLVAIFFDKCINEPRRKKFWMSHFNWIDDFEIYATASMLNTLKEDERISDILESKVNVLNSSGNNSAALLMYIGQYQMIEFSDVGSLYIYKNLYIGNVTYMRELQRPHMDLIQIFYLNKEEGIINHGSKDWEKTLTLWLQHHYPNLKDD